MIALVSLPDLGDAGTVELSRMLLARKRMPEDGRGTLSPMVNAPLAQSVILEPAIPMHLAAWLPRLKQRFVDDIADIQTDPSLGRHISEMQDDEARWS